MNKAIAIDPSLDEAYLRRGMVFLDQELYKDALDYLNQCIDISRKKKYLIEAFKQRAILWILRGRYREAIRDVRSGIQLYALRLSLALLE